MAGGVQHQRECVCAARAVDEDRVADGAACPAADGVGAAVADERIVARAAVHGVVAGAADEEVVAIVAVESAVGRQQVVAGAAIQRDPGDVVHFAQSGQRVVAAIAVDRELIAIGAVGDVAVATR